MIRTNGAKLDPRPGHAGGIAVYPNYSMINHNCVCNVRTMYGPKNKFDYSDFSVN